GGFVSGTWRVGLMLLGAAGIGRGAAAQAPPRLHLEGQWEAKVSDGLHYVMVRADSSAQFGEQVARWRLVGDSLWFTLGDGAWQVYGMKVAGGKRTLSGGGPDKTGPPPRG